MTYMAYKVLEDRYQKHIEHKQIYGKSLNN